MKYIKKFENFSPDLNNESSVLLTDEQLEINKAIQKNPNEVQEIVKLVDLELSKFSENQKIDILENIEMFSKKHNIDLEKTSDLTKIIQDISKLSKEQEVIYKELLNEWKESQRALGKNTKPGQGTRNRLMRQSMQENMISSMVSNIKTGLQKGLNFIDDCLEYLKYRTGMLSSVTSIIFTIITIYSGTFSWWQVVWFVISILYWRISSMFLAKKREFWGDDKKWYY